MLIFSPQAQITALHSYHFSSRYKQGRTHTCSHLHKHTHVHMHITHSRNKSWRAQKLTLTLMSHTDSMCVNSSGSETKSARPPVTCQWQQAHIEIRKSSIEGCGHMRNIPLFLRQRLLSYKAWTTFVSDGAPVL